MFSLFRYSLILLLLAVLGGKFVQSVSAVNPNIAIYSDQYRTQLEKYRLQYDHTVISLSQYQNLKTLASQEEAVQSMRDFLLIRADVVTTHFNVLAETLIDRQGVDPVWAASASALLTARKSDLAAHRARSDIAVDRIKADSEAVWFQQDQENLFVAADRAQSLIGIGRTREAIAALETTKTHLDAWISSASMSETARVEKKRGSDELGRTIDAAKLSLSQAQVYYLQTSNESSTVLIYPRIRPMLLDSYTQVLRGVDFAKELSQ